MIYPAFSILHISDLHKDADASYDQLLASLEDDRVIWRNGNPTILEPSFIVVSGDLIQGCELNMTKKAATEMLDRQYAEVEAFLAALANRFLNGDRNRIIIVSGNHDVSRNASQRSMTYVDEKERDAVYKTFVSSRGKSCLYRWSWKDFSFCKIVKDDIYKERFDAYLSFYNRFYHGVREELKDCVDNVGIVEFPEFNITFACYNSCADLDHLNETGKISNVALYCKREELQDLYDNHRIIIGVWHHHIYGSPYFPNFMDRDVLRLLHKRHIQIGLFGHQHCIEVADEYKNIEEKGADSESILLISSGTLFGGRKQLTSGKPRQYNVIEIEQKNGEAQVRIHVREDESGDKPDPSWKKHLVAQGNFIERIIYFKKKMVNDVIIEIDNAVRTGGNLKDGIIELQTLLSSQNTGTENQMILKFIDEYLQKLNANDEADFIIDRFNEPQNEVERANLLEAYISKNMIEEAQKLVDLIKEPKPIEEKAIEHLKNVLRWKK
jgi:predicted MPP superfamily phosphohydrolase